MAIRLNKLLTGHTITDELFTRTSSTALGLEHDTIRGTTDLEIWTGAGKTGTKLTITTDYTVSDTDTALTSEAGVTIYTKVAIVNGTYQNTNLYANYKTVGDYNDADDINFNKYTQTITANYTAIQSDKTILVNTNNAIPVGVIAGLPIGFELEVQRVSSGLTANAVTLGFTGETLNGVGSFAIFGNSIAKTAKYKENFVIRKITATTWAFVSGEDSGSNSNGYYKKHGNGFVDFMIPRFTLNATGISVFTLPMAITSDINGTISLSTAPAVSAGGTQIAWLSGTTGYAIDTSISGNNMSLQGLALWY